MYSFGSKDLAGYLNTGINVFPEGNLLQNIRLGMACSQFNYSDGSIPLRYTKLVPQISFALKNSSVRSPLKKKINLRLVKIFKDDISFDIRPYSEEKIKDDYSILDISFDLNNRRMINPYSVLIDLQQAKEMVKYSITGIYKISFDVPKKGLDIRFFYGNFAVKPTNLNNDFRFRLSGPTGSQDYLYDEVFTGRSETEGILSQQMTEKDGNFKVYTPLGQTWGWIVALNFNSSLPWKIPVKVFADIGTFKGAKNATSFSEPLQYDAGIDLCLVDKVFEIYFPVTMSEDLNKLSKLYYKNYWQRIRFTLNLTKLNPFNLIRNFEF